MYWLKKIAILNNIKLFIYSNTIHHRHHMQQIASKVSGTRKNLEHKFWYESENYYAFLCVSMFFIYDLKSNKKNLFYDYNFFNVCVCVRLK